MNRSVMNPSTGAAQVPNLKLRGMDKAYVLKGQQISKPIRSGQDDDVDEESWNRLIRGQLEDLLPLASNEIRVFLSSTFSDFKVERNYLVQHAFPQLKELCTVNGLDFRVCDMRWGVTDSAVNEHLVEKLCLREIDSCRRLSVGPFFVALLGNRYGYQPIPPELPSEDFQMLRGLAEECSPKTVHLLDEWYREDANAVPAMHVLLPIRTKFPHYGDYQNEQLRYEAGNQWWLVEEGIRNTFKKTLKRALDQGKITAEERHAYSKGVTEAELARALFEPSHPGCADRCLVYFRDLTGLKDSLGDDMAVKYADVVLRDNVWTLLEEPLTLMRSLKERVKNCGVRMKEFNLPWNSEGVSPRDVELHRRYLDALCAQLVKDMRVAVQRCSQTTEKGAERGRRILQSELIHHQHFCREKAAIFCGRSDELDNIRRRWLETHKPTQSPLVLHAESGRGKTAMLAMIARLVPQWFGEESVCVVRFLGTSALSSTIYNVLYSLCQQIACAYKIKLPTRKIQSIKSLRAFFPRLLHSVSMKAARHIPLVIILDSLDQLRPSDYAYSCFWLPEMMPRGVYMIVSTLPLECGILSSLRERIRDEDSFIELASLSKAAIQQILYSYEIHKGRKLTTSQTELVLTKLEANPFPLYVKLILDESLAWQSFTPTEECVLADTVQDAVRFLFEKLESRYGQCLMRYTMGFLTIGINGLSEVELEDALSCQDDVLNEVYRYHDPPIKGVIRIPSLLWSRIHYDLKDYIVEQMTDGKLTLSWYHRQFIEAATERYVTSDSWHHLHASLAALYTAEAPIRRTIVLSNVKRHSEIPNADRLISFSRVSEFNPRKLRALPYHLLHSGNVDLLLETCVANAYFLKCYCRAFGLQECVDWLRVCCEALPQDSRMASILDCITFLQPYLETDQDAMTVQLLAQLQRPHLLEGDPLQRLCAQCVEDLRQRHAGGALVPAFACAPSCLGGLKWCKENVESVHSMPWDDSVLVLVIRESKQWLVKVFSVDDCATLCTVGLEAQPIKCELNLQKTMLFVMDIRWLCVYDLDSGQMIGRHGVYINNKVLLNQSLAISPDVSWVAIAAEDRIALLANRGPNVDKKMLSHQILLVAKEIDRTFALLFLHPDAHRLLLTGHTYRLGLDKQFIIKCWNYEKRTELWSLVVGTLPAASPDQLHLLPGPVGDTVLVVLPDASCHCVDALMGTVKSTQRPDTKGKAVRLKMLITDGSECMLTLTCAVDKDTLVMILNQDGSLKAPLLRFPASAEHNVSCALFSGDGTLVKGSTRGLVARTTLTGDRDASALDFSASWHAQQDRVTFLRWRDDRRLYTYSSNDRVLKLWDLHLMLPEKDEEEELFPVDQSSLDSSTPSLADLDMLCFCLCNSRTSLITTSTTGALHMWSTEDARFLRKLTFTAHEDHLDTKQPQWDTVDQLACFCANRYLVLTATNGIFVCDLASEKVLVAGSKPLRWYSFPANEGDRLCCLRSIENTKRGEHYLCLEVVSVPNLSMVNQKRFLVPVGCADAAMRTVTFTPSGSHVVVTWKATGKSGNGTCQAWSGHLGESGGSLVLTACTSEADRTKTKTTYLGNNPSQPVHCVVPLGGGATVLVGGQGDLPTWDLVSGGCRLQRVPNFHTWFKHSVTVNMAGGLQALSGGDPGSPLAQGGQPAWSGPTGAKGKQGGGGAPSNPSLASESAAGQFDKLPITALCVSNRGDVVASGCAGGRVIVWWPHRLAELQGQEPDSGRIYRLILREAHKDKVTCMSISTSGHLLASAGADKQIFLVDVTSVCLLHRILVHMIPDRLEFAGVEDSVLVGWTSHMAQCKLLLFRVFTQETSRHEVDDLEQDKVTS